MTATDRGPEFDQYALRGPYVEVFEKAIFGLVASLLDSSLIRSLFDGAAMSDVC